MRKSVDTQKPPSAQDVGPREGLKPVAVHMRAVLERLAKQIAERGQ